MREEKQAMPVTEGWKLYQTLQAVEVSGPASYAVRYQTRLPVPGKQKKKNASRKDPSVEYQYQAYRFRGYLNENKIETLPEGYVFQTA